MKNKIDLKKFSIVSRQDSNSKQLEDKIKSELMDHGFIYDYANPELVICVGGDGTFLYAIHHYLKQLNELYFVAIHTGNLGFFTDYKEDQVDVCIDEIISGEYYEIYAASLLEAKVKDEILYALNEIRIENILRTQAFDIYIDGEYFETFKGNGICLSSQVGSTAYNRSLRGAVLDDRLTLMQLSEIAGIHDSKHRSIGVPYIFRDDRVVSFCSDNFTNAYLCYDHKHIHLDAATKVSCQISNKQVKFIRYHKYSYLKRVRTLY